MSAHKASGQWRSKQGLLELYKGKKWKPYLFKVTGSTYLHYFGDKKMSEAKEQIFLTAVKSIDIPPRIPKGGQFVFEVNFNGKNSPWILNAHSEEERTQWMEVILPGSSKPLVSPLLRTPSPVPTTPPSHFDSTLQQPQFQSNDRADFVKSMPHPLPNVNKDASFTQSITPMSQPHPQATTNPYVRSPIRSHFSPTPPPRLDIPGKPSDYLEPSALNLPLQRSSPIVSPVRSLPTSPPSQIVPKLTTKMSFDSNIGNRTTMALAEVMTLEQEIYGDDDDNTDNSFLTAVLPTCKVEKPSQDNVCPINQQYLVLQDKKSVEASPQIQKSEDVEVTSSDQVMEVLSRQFTPDQLSVLLAMLQKLRVGESSGDGGESSRENSLTPSSERNLEGGQLGYLVTKTAGKLSESFLQTDEDDPMNYDKRPSWAKAIYEEQMGTTLLSNSFDSDTYIISRSELNNMNRIGAGQFGEVYKADYIPEGCGPEDAIKVAVKTAKKDCDEQQRRDMLREIAAMANMIHPNIVRLYGIITEGSVTPWLVLEYLPYGDLKSYLSKSPKKTNETLVKYMVDVAMGMHYIAERGLVHRDLAARNILVGEGEICKVADFGLLRELPQDDSIYVSTSNVPCPIRWMPPEAISERSFSVASDVWSFGILQWEIFNPKKMPYAGMDNYAVVGKVREGYRMPIPRGCPPMVARVMKACWHADPNKRPSFLLIATLLTTKVSSSVSASSPVEGTSTTYSNDVYL